MESRAEMAPLPSCTVCGITDVLRCAKCKTTYYCSAEHQQIDWPAHRHDCRRLAKEKSHNKIQQLQQAVAAATLTNHMPPNVSHQLNLQQPQPWQQLQNGSGLGTAADMSFSSATAAFTTAAAVVPPAISVIMGTNENEILHSKAESVSQHINSGYHGHIEANSTTTEQMQFCGGAAEADDGGGAVDSMAADMYFTQDPRLQQPQFPHFSNESKDTEKSSSYKIGRGDENVMGVVNERRYEDLCRNIINDLNQYGLSVVDDFLGMEKGLDILNEVHRMYAAGVFKDGQLVNNFLPQQDMRTIRGDKITWVKGVEPGCINVGYLVNQIDAVICRANSMRNNGKLGNYNIKERTKAMVACYPGSGSHYVVHVDNPNKDGRVITAIYYLNVNWDTKRSGGVLRIFPEPGNSIADIEPKFDRLIFFWSDKRNPHEVQPAHRTRYAITVWYFDAYEREAALSRCKYSRNNGRTSMANAPTTTTTTTAASNNAAIINQGSNSSNTSNSTHTQANFNKMANSNANANPNVNSSSNSTNEICT